MPPMPATSSARCLTPQDLSFQRRRGPGRCTEPVACCRCRNLALSRRARRTQNRPHPRSKPCSTAPASNFRAASETIWPEGTAFAALALQKPEESAKSTAFLTSVARIRFHPQAISMPPQPAAWRPGSPLARQRRWPTRPSLSIIIAAPLWPRRHGRR